MDTPQFPTGSAVPHSSSTSGPSTAELQREINSMRLLFTITLAILLLISLVADMLIYKHVTKVRRQVDVAQEQVTKFSADYENVLKPRVNAFLQSLVRFAQANPDFIPILQKYPIQSQPPAGAAASGAPKAP